MDRPAMAYVAEVDSKFVGMFFHLRRVVQILANGGFKYAVPSGGAMAPRSKRARA